MKLMELIKHDFRKHKVLNTLILITFVIFYIFSLFSEPFLVIDGVLDEYSSEPLPFTLGTCTFGMFIWFRFLIPGTLYFTKTVKYISYYKKDYDFILSNTNYKGYHLFLYSTIKYFIVCLIVLVGDIVTNLNAGVTLSELLSVFTNYNFYLSFIGFFLLSISTKSIIKLVLLKANIEQFKSTLDEEIPNQFSLSINAPLTKEQNKYRTKFIVLTILIYAIATIIGLLQLLTGNTLFIFIISMLTIDSIIVTIRYYKESKVFNAKVFKNKIIYLGSTLFKILTFTVCIYAFTFINDIDSLDPSLAKLLLVLFSVLLGIGVYAVLSELIKYKVRGYNYDL